jgi:hypothetical protein
MKHKLLKVTIPACYTAYAFTFHALASPGRNRNCAAVWSIFVCVLYSMSEKDSNQVESFLAGCFQREIKLLASADLVHSCASREHVLCGRLLLLCVL